MNTLYPAHWLSLAGERDTEQIERYGKPCPCFRREFSLLDKPLKSAELWATAIGVFKAYVNGEPADDDYMSPGFTDYRVRIPWLKYDITGLVKKDNAVVLVAGDGWAAGYMGNRMLRRNYYRDVSVCAKIVIEYSDGEKQEIITDDAWRVDTDEIMRTDNYMGEVVDHRAAKDKRFYLPGYDYSEGGWQKPVYRDYWINYARLSEEVEPRIKVMHTLVPEKISHSGRKTIYDMKQNMVGVVRLRVKGTAGTVLRLRYGEMLEKDGTLYVENLRRAESTDTFILKGGEEEEFRPLFTFHGFRYVEVRVTGSAEIIAMTGEVDCTEAYAEAKAQGRSFFLYYLYAILRAANEIKEFRYRWDKHGQVVCHDTVDITTPIAVPGKTFYTVRIPWNSDFKAFYEEARRIITSIPEDGDPYGTDKEIAAQGDFDVILLSATPKLYFTSISYTQYAPGHPLDYPLMNAGKAVTREGRLVMPIALTVSHAFVDGAHISLFFEKVEKYLKER